MSTIADKLLQVNGIKQNIKTAIEEKGINMTDVPFTDYHNKIAQIESGSQSSTKFWGFPEVENIPTNTIALIIADTHRKLTFRSRTYNNIGSYTVTVTGGEEGSYVINGVTTALGVPTSFSSGTLCEIIVGDNGKDVGIFKTFKIIIEANFHETLAFNLEPNSDAATVTTTSIIYANLNYPQKVADRAFYNDNNLSYHNGKRASMLMNVKLSQVTALENLCLSYTTALSTVFIPKSVIEIDSPFTYCITLKEIVFEKDSQMRYLTGNLCGSCYALERIINSEHLIMEATSAVNMYNIYNLEELNFDKTNINKSFTVYAHSSVSVRNVKGKLRKFKFNSYTADYDMYKEDYKKGDLVWYDNKCWKCIQDTTQAGLIYDTDFFESIANRTRASTFDGTAPQLRITNMEMPKLAIEDVLNQIIETGVIGKEVSFLGCEGCSDFSSTEKVNWATATGWTIIW